MNNVNIIYIHKTYFKKINKFKVQELSYTDPVATDFFQRGLN